MNRNRLACAAWTVALCFVPRPVGAQSTPRNQAPDAAVLPPTIAIFPLPDVVLFPNVPRPLHIFEPRYRAMVADALKGDRIIGMVLLRPGYETDYEGRPPIYPVGCAGVITDVEGLPDGRFNIVLRGLVKFRVMSEEGGRPYRLAHVDAIPELPDDQERTALRGQRRRLETLLAASLGRSGSTPVPASVSDEDLVNTLAQYLELDPIDRQELLERDGVLSRAEGLIGLLEASRAR